VVLATKVEQLVLEIDVEHVEWVVGEVASRNLKVGVHSADNKLEK